MPFSRSEIHNYPAVNSFHGLLFDYNKITLFKRFFFAYFSKISYEFEFAGRAFI